MNIPNANRHDLKDFEPAGQSTFPTKNLNGGYEWQTIYFKRPVIDVVDGANAPPTENDRDRYILLQLSTSVVHSQWDGNSFNDIVEYINDDDAWKAETPVESVWADVQDKNTLYRFDGTNWDSLLSIVGGYANNVDFFPNGRENKGNYPAGLTKDFDGDGTGDAPVYITGFVPSDFGSITEMVLEVIPDGGFTNGDIDISSQYGAVGEQFDAHSESDTASTYNLTSGEITEIDISGLFGNLAAGDRFGVKVDNHETTGLYVTRIRLKYDI